MFGALAQRPAFAETIGARLRLAEMGNDFDFWVQRHSSNVTLQIWLAPRS